MTSPSIDRVRRGNSSVSDRLASPAQVLAHIAPAAAPAAAQPVEV